MSDTCGDVIDGVEFPSLQYNHENWSCSEKVQRVDWIPRAKIASSFVRPGDRVIDVGCGKQFPKLFLPQGCFYQPSDIVKRSPDTIIADLSKNEFPEGNYDVGMMLGVLEFVPNIDFIFHKFSQSVDRLVFSYCLPRKDCEYWLHFRANSKFLTCYTGDEIQQHLEERGFRLVHMEKVGRAYAAATQAIVVADKVGGSFLPRLPAE